MVKENNLKMCNNFHDIHASVIARILRVKPDPRGDGIRLSRKVEGCAKRGHPSSQRGRKRGANAHR